jgi:hypothetical protein
VVALVAVVLDIVRGNLRIKCRKLYVAVALCVLVWLGLSIFQEPILRCFISAVKFSDKFHPQIVAKFYPKNNR